MWHYNFIKMWEIIAKKNFWIMCSRIALLSSVIVSSAFPSSAVLFAHWPISPPLLLSTASSPSKVSRQWATSKVRLLWTFFLESRRTIIAGSGAQKRMLPKNRCERKLGQNKMGEWLRLKERRRKQWYPAVTQARYLGCVECEIFTVNRLRSLSKDLFPPSVRALFCLFPCWERQEGEKEEEEITG